MKALVGMLAAASACFGCQPLPAIDAGPPACGVIATVEATCAPSAKQPDPAYVYYDCVVPGAKGDTAPTFTSKIPVANVPDGGG